MKAPFIVLLALFAVAEQQQCKNPFQNIASSPTPTGPRSAMEYCAQTSNAYGAYFYCQSTQGNLQAGLPNGWTGYCQGGAENLGQFGYSATTFAGGADFVRNHSAASAQCSFIGSGCSGYVRCVR
jgi:hypothetical protein